VGRTKAVVDLRYDINDLNFKNSHMLSELLTHNKARYDAAATVRLSNGIAKRWHVMTTLPRLQMLQGEAKTLGSDVRRQLGEVKLERVVEMESSCAELSSLLAEIEAAKLRRAQAEPLQHQTELQQELSAVKMEMEQTLAGQRSKLEVLKKECTRFKLRLSEVQRRLDIEGPVVYRCTMMSSLSLQSQGKEALRRCFCNQVQVVYSAYRCSVAHRLRVPRCRKSPANSAKGRLLDTWA
jgi:hypothetical protein